MWNHRVWLLGALQLAVAVAGRAEIFRWDSGQPIPGTGHTSPGPKIELCGFALQYADLSNLDLSGARLESSDLTGARFTDSNLTRTSFRDATLTDADFTRAVVTNTICWSTTSGGFTKEQLYSTASYQAKNLTGIGLGKNDLAGWDFEGQNLTGAFLGFGTTLVKTNLTGAVVKGAFFAGAIGFTEEQLYSTASYLENDLRGIVLGGNKFYFDRSDYDGWDFHGQNLADAYLINSTFADVDLRGANLTNAVLSASVLTRADARGALGLSFEGVVENRNAILPDGTIAGLMLAAGETLIIRDDDGVTDLRPHSWLSPRPPISVTIEDGLATMDGSVMQLQFDADPWDSLISFQPGIPVQLGGELLLTFADGVDVPTQIGRTLRLFDWTGVSPNGQFEIQSPYVWDTTNLYTSGSVTLVAVPEPAASILLSGAIAMAIMRRWSERTGHRKPTGALHLQGTSPNV